MEGYLGRFCRAVDAVSIYIIGAVLFAEEVICVSVRGKYRISVFSYEVGNLGECSFSIYSEAFLSGCRSIEPYVACYR